MRSTQVDSLDEQGEEVSQASLSQSQVGQDFKVKDYSRYANQAQVCPLHKLGMEFYCKDHRQMICLNCVQSKDHQYHRIIDQYEINKIAIEQRIRIDNLHIALKNSHLAYESEQKTFLVEVRQMLQNREREMTVLIEQKYQDLISKLSSQKDLAIKQLSILVLKAEDFVRDTMSHSQKDICYQITEFHRSLDKINLSKQSQLLDQGEELTRTAESIIDKLSKYLVSEKQLISNIVSNSIKVKIVEPHIENFCSVSTSLEQSNTNKPIIRLSGTSKHTIEFLAYSKNTSSHPNHSITTQSRQVRTEADQDTPAIDTNHPQRFTFSGVKAEATKTQPIRQPSPRSKSIESRVFERVKNQLLTHKEMEKLDLSNQDLVDIDVYKLCEWLSSSKSNVESIKLTKNKITDTGVQYLLRCLQDKPLIHTINLTSNLCTKKTLDIINSFQSKQRLHLKNIYLTNCKMNQVSCKPDQEHFMNKGINVYI